MFGFLRPAAMATIPAAEAKSRFDAGNAVAVDVRESFEWAQGHIPKALHAPLSDLQHSAKSLPRDKALVIYCLSGARSAKAAAQLKALGFADVTNLAGGIGAWRAHGFPMVAG